MFGLPPTTTTIMLGILGFWVVYTLVFYFTTKNWAVEDSNGDDEGVTG